MSDTTNPKVRAASRVVVIGAAAACFAGLYGVTAPDTVVPASFGTALPESASHQSSNPTPIPPIPGTNSGSGTATSWDANGRPTHVTYSGPVVPPTTNVPMGGNSPHYDRNGRPMVPGLPPSGSGVVVGGVPPVSGPSPSGPTHVTLSTIPPQIPHAPPRRNPLDYPQTPAEWQAAGQRAQVRNDQANNTFATAAGIGYSNGTYFVNGRTFTDRGAAIFERNHPSPR